MGLSRSQQMSRIKGRDTAPELALRRELHHRGLRFRVQRRTEGSRPDVVFVSRRVAVFVDGCFWHGCPEHYIAPKSRQEFWKSKLRDNRRRDRQQDEVLTDAGWRVIRVWEHEISADLEAVADRVVGALAE